MSTLIRIAAWLLLAALVFVTLAPIGLRPVLAESPTIERALAYGGLGLLLALAYPRPRFAALVACVVVAGLLEAGQELSPSRHGRVSDFLVKAAAAAIGALVAAAIQARLDRRRLGPAAPEA